MKHVLLIALFASTAHAESRTAVTWGEPEPQPQKALVRLGGIDEGSVDHASLSITSDATTIHAQLTLALSTRNETPTDLHMPLVVSGDTQVTDLAIAFGADMFLGGQLVAAAEALERYELIVSAVKDPALLRWVAKEKQRTKFELRAFPVTSKTPAKVTIAMTLPRHASIVFDPGPRQLAQLDVTVDGSSERLTKVDSPRTFAIVTKKERPSWMTEDTARRQRPYVDEKRSLFAGVSTPAAPQIQRRRTEMPRVRWTDRKREVREHLRTRQEALAHCYAFARELDAMSVPYVDLAIAIQADGRVSETDVTGDLDSGVLHSCVAEEVLSWRFRDADRDSVVRESIDLRFPD